MRISFPYPEMKSLDVPEQNLLGIFSPSIVQIVKSEKEIIEEGFSRPIGSHSLSQMLRGCKNVLILVDDYTRATTPVQKILPRLMSELENGGIKHSDIKIMIALGTHRPMTDEEIKRFLASSGIDYMEMIEKCRIFTNPILKFENFI